MIAAAEASAIESRVGHYYQMDGTYLVGREKVREYARAVQDYHPAHWDVAAATELGYSGLVAPLTFTSAPGMSCNRRMFEQVVVGYDTYLQTEEVFEQHRPIVAGDELRLAAAGEAHRPVGVGGEPGEGSRRGAVVLVDVQLRPLVDAGDVLQVQRVEAELIGQPGRVGQLRVLQIVDRVDERTAAGAQRASDS